MGKLRDFAGSVEDAVSDFGNLVRGAADKLLEVPQVFYVGDSYVLTDVSKIERDGRTCQYNLVVLHKNDRIAYISGDHNTAVVVEQRHKLITGDVVRNVLLLTFAEWSMLRGRVLFTWTNQSELAKLHKAQGHG